MEPLTSIQSIVTLFFTSLVFALYYFFIYIHDRQRYIAIWGFGWVIYSVGYLLYFLLADHEFSIVFKYFFSIVSSLFLLVGTLTFINSSYYIKWTKISIWIGIFTLGGCWLLLVAGDKETLSNFFAFFTAILLSAISVWSGTAFLFNSNRREEFPPDQWNADDADIIRHIAGWGFIAWGIHKGYYPFVNPDFFASQWNYLSSIVLTNIVNISMILTYISENNMEVTKRENLYRLLAEKSQDIIATVSMVPVMRFSYISPAVYTVTGYGQSEFYEDFQLFLKIIHQEDQSRYTEFLNDASIASAALTFRVIRKDQAVVWLEQHTTLIADDKTGVSFEAILRDITDRKEIEENLFRSETARRHLLANISHELKTPITSIIGYLSIILDNINRSPKEYAAYVKTCLDKSLTLDGLIQDLFELSKLEAHQIQFDFQPIPAGELALSLYERFVLDIRKNGLEPRLLRYCPAGCPQCPLVLVDQKRIEQVFRNLIMNSAHHTDTGGYILLRCDCRPGRLENPSGDVVIFAVEDNGRGIDPGDIPYVFERFFKKKIILKGEESGMDMGIFGEGTGLGLSISKEIVHGHGGRIWAESKPRERTTLFFTIPIEHEF